MANITWVYDGVFCSAKFVKASKVVRHCYGCGQRLDIGSPSWRVWSPDNPHTVCCECWDHFESCADCRREQATWDDVATCRAETAKEDANG